LGVPPPPPPPEVPPPPPQEAASAAPSSRAARGSNAAALPHAWRVCGAACQESVRARFRKASQPSRARSPKYNAAGGTRGIAGAAGRLEPAVVWTLKLTVTALDPLGVNDDGETEHVECAGAPEQVSVTGLLNPPSGDTSSV
jgi:hypothetical protein